MFHPVMIERDFTTGVQDEARAMARYAEREGDVGTGDLLVSDVIRTNEVQVWFMAEHRIVTSAVVE